MFPKSNILIMGVSGSGKTTIARQVSQKLNFQFLEADGFHPKENIEKMSQGKPLNDLDREPWLIAISEALTELEGKGFVLACSALKESYRELLQKGLEKPLFIFYLEGSFEQILERMSKRKDHFMPETLLKSQFDTLEIPQGAVRINIENSPEVITEIIIEKIKEIK